jgi:hypothetical protein
LSKRVRANFGYRRSLRGGTVEAMSRPGAGEVTKEVEVEVTVMLSS